MIQQLPKNGADASTTTATTRTKTKKGNPLMTPKALALSLSPPRIPPFGTIQRELYNHPSTNKNHQQTKYLYERNTQVQRYLNDNNNNNHYHVRSIHTTTGGVDPSTKAIDPTFHRRLLRPHLQHDSSDEDDITTRRRRNYNFTTKYNYRYPRQHPYLLQRSDDRVTRYLFGSGMLLSLEQQNSLRDAGIFRSIVDILATITIPPILLVSNPPSKLLIPYIRLLQMCETISYGPNTSYQYIHLYPSLQLQKNTQHSSLPPQQPRRLIVFVHGGAWGSGQPWMYRLIAAPFLFHPPNMDDPSYCYSVAVIGHRTYPNGSTLQEQVSDIRTALNVLIEQYAYLYDYSNITIIGHSSGAHVALSMVVDFIEEKLKKLNVLQQNVDDSEHTSTDVIPMIESLPFDSFCGISGPYDISHHFDYESSRGVEELSPMKPVNGYTRQSFRANSPLWRLTNDTLKCLYPNVESLISQLCPNIALIHGIEDDTVPFTATADAARRLRMLGVTKVQEIYIPHTGHQDAILQYMLGGRTCSALMEWILNLQDPSSDTNHSQQIITKLRSRL